MLNPHSGLFPHVENYFHMLRTVSTCWELFSHAENCFHMLRALTWASHHCFGTCPCVHLNIEAFRHWWSILCLGILLYCVLCVMPGRTPATDHYYQHERHEINNLIFCADSQMAYTRAEMIYWSDDEVCLNDIGATIFKQNNQGASVVVEGRVRNKEHPRSSWGMWPLLPMAS